MNKLVFLNDSFRAWAKDNKIPAIKAIRNSAIIYNTYGERSTQIGLKEAKDLIEDMIDNNYAIISDEFAKKITDDLPLKEIGIFFLSDTDPKEEFYREAVKVLNLYVEKESFEKAEVMLSILRIIKDEL